MEVEYWSRLQRNKCIAERILPDVSIYFSLQNCAGMRGPPPASMGSGGPGSMGPGGPGGPGGMGPGGPGGMGPGPAGMPPMSMWVKVISLGLTISVLWSSFTVNTDYCIRRSSLRLRPASQLNRVAVVTVIFTSVGKINIGDFQIFINVR